jgi:hypothetical protein
VFHAPPKAIRAHVEADLSGIVVSFDLETNLRGNILCANFLDVKLLGPNTFCLWGLNETTNTSLLYLSCPKNDWYLMVDDTIVFLENKVYSADGLSAPVAAGQSNGVVVARPLAMAESAQRSLLQLVFTSIPTASIILNAPGNITYCSNLRLDTSLSTGGGGAH